MVDLGVVGEKKGSEDRAEVQRKKNPGDKLCNEFICLIHIVRQSDEKCTLNITIITKEKSLLL